MGKNMLINVVRTILLDDSVITCSLNDSPFGIDALEELNLLDFKVDLNNVKSGNSSPIVKLGTSAEHKALFDSDLSLKN